VFYGPTSATIVLNALFGKSATLPRDRSRIHAEYFYFLADIVNQYKQADNF